MEENVMKKLLITIIALIAYTQTALPQWHECADPYWPAQAITSCDSMVFVGGAKSIYKSSDFGEKWVDASSGIGDKYIQCLASYGSDLYAGSSKGGICISRNNGISWKTVNSGLTCQYINCIAAGASGVYAGTMTGLFKSTNNGTTWNRIDNGFSVSSIQSLAVDGNKVYAGTSSRMVMITTDGGITWNTSNTGIEGGSIKSILVVGSRIFAAYYGGILLSTDDGATWNPVNSGLTNPYVDYLVCKGSIIFASTLNGVFMSKNYGNFWYRVDNGFPNSNTLCLGINGSTLYAVTSGRIHKAATDDLLQSIYTTNKFNITVTPSVDMCQGDEIQIGVKSVYNGMEPFTCQWSPSDGLSSVSDPVVTASPTVTTTYRLIITDNLSAIDTEFVTVNVHPLPVPDADDINASVDETVTFYARANMNCYFRWYDAPTGGNLLLADKEYSVIADEEATFYLEAVDETYGCISNPRKEVHLFVTKKASPSGAEDENIAQGISIASVSPNPSDGGMIMIELKAMAESDVELVLYDLLGAPVMELKTRVPAGSSFVAMEPAQSLSSGAYILKLKSSAGGDSKMVIIK